MSRHHTKRRILGLAPSSRGVGFAVLDHGVLSNWGVKSARKNKNDTALTKLQGLIDHYEPSAIVLEDWSLESSRRADRIRRLCVRITALAKRKGVHVKVLDRKKVRRAFFADRMGTKYEIAQMLAEQYPRDLRRVLPQKRKVWNSEPHQMDVFDAVALAVAFENGSRGTPKNEVRNHDDLG